MRAWILPSGESAVVFAVVMSVRYTRQFSSPPVSCVYRIWLLLRAQRNERMPRFVSLVMTLASVRLPLGATHTFSTPLCGAMKAMCLPSGLIAALVRVGFPKMSFRAMTSLPGLVGDVFGACAMPIAIGESVATRSRVLNFMRSSGSFVVGIGVAPYARAASGAVAGNTTGD